MSVHVSCSTLADARNAGSGDVSALLVGSLSFGHLIPGRFLLRGFLPVEILYDPRHISPRLVIRRYSTKLLNALRAGVVRRQCPHHVEIIFLHEFSEIFRSTLNVRLWIERI